MAGPPVEVQVRVNTGGSVAGSASSNWKAISPGIVTCPAGGTNITLSVAILIFKFGGKNPSHTCGRVLTPPFTVSIMLLSSTRFS